MIRLSLLLALVLIAGCGARQMTETTTITPTQRPDQMPFIPPEFDTAASRTCLTLGGTLTIKSGAPSGLCALPDGARVDSEQLLTETKAPG